MFARRRHEWTAAASTVGRGLFATTAKALLGHGAACIAGAAATTAGALLGHGAV